MLNKFKLITTSSTIAIVTSTIVIIDITRTSANPFSTLLKNIKFTGSKLTIINPFKSTTSFTLNKPSSEGKLSYSYGNENTQLSINLWTRIKKFFTKNNSKSFKINISGNLNLAFENDEKLTTTTHILKGNQEKISKSKERRLYLMSKHNDVILSTENIKTSINNKNLNQEANISIAKESKTSPNAKVLDINSKLKSMLTTLDDKLDYKTVIEDSINKTNNPNVKTALYKHLDNTESEIMNLQIKIEKLQTLIHITQNKN